jgi:hypothetical protein
MPIAAGISAPFCPACSSLQAITKKTGAHRASSRRRPAVAGCAMGLTFSWSMSAIAGSRM